MISEPLRKARAYERQKEKDIAPDTRPAFHLSARVGWMNDPNGFSFYQGRWHLFYQYNPYAVHWGPMHWAHAVSDDLLRWENLPAALAPDMPYDCMGGCFSGSAHTLPDGRHLLMYTGVGHRRGHEEQEAQVQCIAVGDGVRYEKAAHNPVLDERDLPAGADFADFRDPKLFRRADGAYRAVIANRAADGSGQALLFKSEDGLCWSFAKVLCANRFRYGTMWECPDFFTLNGKGVLFISPQDMTAEEPRFHSGSGNIAIIGSWDEESETFTEERVQVIDHGVDFYAMQTAPAPDGRRIMIAWMQNWDCQEHLPGEAWFGQMTLPREIRVEDGRLLQQPIRELVSLRTGCVRRSGVHVAAHTALEGVRGRYADMEIAVRGAYSRFTVNLAEDKTHKTTLTYEPETGLLTLDRTHSGTRRAFAHSRICALRAGQTLALRIILDRNSVEVFADGGEKAMSMALVTPVSADGVSFEAQGDAVMDIAMHELAH